MDGFLVIPGWVTELGLSSNEALVFSLIYGFTQDGKTMFNGGRKYIAKWTMATTRTVDRSLNTLVERGLIEKIPVKANGVIRNRYRAIPNVYENDDNDVESGTVDKMSTPIDKMSTPYDNLSRSLDNINIPSLINPIIEDICDKEHIENNKDYIEHIEDIKEHTETYKDDISPSKKKRFVKPSVEEVQAYIDEKGYHFDAESFVAFYESKDWYVGKNKMTSWQSCCVTWEKRCKADTKAKKKPVGNEEYYDMVARWANDEE